MLLKSIRATALFGKLLSIIILTKFGYNEASSVLAILFTASTIFNSIIPPFHKEIYINSIKLSITDYIETISKYIFPLLVITPIASVFISSILKLYINLNTEISLNILLIIIYIFSEKIFDELNRYALTFKKYYPWNISCLSRYLLSNLIILLLVLQNSYSQESTVKIILLCYTLSTMLSLISCVRIKHIRKFIFNKDKIIKSFKFNNFLNKQLFRAWLVSLVMLFPTFSERIASLTGKAGDSSKIFIAISIIQLISFVIDLQIHSTKKSEIIKNRSLNELIYNTYILPFSGLIISSVCIIYYLFNSIDSINNNLVNISTIFILGISILLNSLSLIQEEKLFWAKEYKKLFIEMMIISILILLSFIFFNSNSLILSIGIIFSSSTRFFLSSKLNNEN